MLLLFYLLRLQFIFLEHLHLAACSICRSTVYLVLGSSLLHLSVCQSLLFQLVAYSTCHSTTLFFRYPSAPPVPQLSFLTQQPDPPVLSTSLGLGNNLLHMYVGRLISFQVTVRSTCHFLVAAFFNWQPILFQVAVCSTCLLTSRRLLTTSTPTRFATFPALPPQSFFSRSIWFHNVTVHIVWFLLRLIG